MFKQKKEAKFASSFLIVFFYALLFLKLTAIIPQIAPIIEPKRRSFKRVLEKLNSPSKIENVTNAKAV